MSRQHRIIRLSKAAKRPTAFRTPLLVRALEDRVVPTTFTVTNLGDAGTGSGANGDLRYCINQSNSNAGANTIDATGVSGTILLTSALPVIATGNLLTITGPGPNQLTINANHVSRVFSDAAATLTVSGMTLTGGAVANANGGAIQMTATNASLTVNNTYLANNSAGSSGGAIYMTTGGSLLITNSIVSGNTAANSPGAGGGSGGGIDLEGGSSLTIRDCTVSLNNAGIKGGGIGFSGMTSGGDKLVIDNSTIANNTAVDGGGLAYASATGTAQITSSTLTANIATDLKTTGLLNAGAGGGGIAFTGGYGLPTATLLLDNTILAGNSAANGFADISNAASSNSIVANFSALGTSAGYSLSSPSGNNLTGVNASAPALMLGPLTATAFGPGQSLPVCPLQLGGSAIAAGDPALNGTADERGVARPQQSAPLTAPDIGAFERAPGPDVSPTAANVIVANGNNYSFTITYTDNVPINTTSLGSGNVTVSTPAGVPAVTVVFDGANVSNTNSVVATYYFTPPNGSWVKTDNGAYTINVGASPVSDANGAVAAGTIGTFQSLVPTTFTVTQTTDTNPSGGGSGSGTSGDLRYCITHANLDITPTGAYPQDTIVFSNSTAGGAVNFYSGSAYVVTPKAALPAIIDPVSIVGTGSALLNLSPPGLNITAPLNQSVSVSGLTIGSATGAIGTGITLGSGNLSLTDVIVRNFRNSQSGAGVIASGASALTLTNCTITGNSTAGNGAGIELAAAGATLTIVNSAIAANTVGVAGASGGNGGAIFAAGADLISISNCTVANNVANKGNGNGGGIDMAASGGSLIINESTISGNSAGGPNGGGGIYFLGTPGAGGFSIANSTIAGNRAVNGGGIELVNFSGAVNIASSTITANSAADNVQFDGLGGGGIGLKTVTNAATIALDNTIVSGNTAVNGLADISVVPVTILPITVSAKYSALGSSQGYTLTDMGHNLPIGTSLLLGPLANNGGPTQTVSLLAGSPAVDAGDPTNFPTDQRGTFRPQGAFDDIGAYERVAGTLGAAAIAQNVTATNAATANPYQFTVIYANDLATIALNTIAASNVTVTPPSGAAPTVTVANVDARNPNSVVVTYQFTPAGGAWLPADDGFYKITMANNQVQDSNGAVVPAGPLATFQVSVPAVFTVTDFLDDANPGSLRYAVNQAIASASPATIVFSSSSANGAVNFYDGSRHVINLTSALPTINNDLTLTGPGSSVLTVSGDNKDFRIFNIGNTSRVLTVSMSGLTITHGYASSGAGIADAGDLVTLTDVTIENNSGGGGGVYSSGVLAVRNSDVQSNTGAGIGGSGATFVVNNSIMSTNTGTGISLTGVLSASNSDISGNSGSGIGANGTAILINDTIANNRANSAAGLEVSGIVSISDTTIAGNTADAFYGGLENGGPTSLSIDHSTFTGNVSLVPTASSGGGAIYFNGTPGPGGFTISNSTITNNSAASCGGGILLAKFGGTLNVVSSTITGNTAGSGIGTTTNYPYGGGGIDFRSGAAAGAGTINLDNSIVSGNSLSAAINNNNPDLANIATSGLIIGNIVGTNNAIGSINDSTYTPGLGDLPLGANLDLQPLADNGGPTQTIAFAANSPLLNAGDPALASTTDQRGQPRTTGSAPDIGAYEYQPITVSNIQVNDGSAQRSEVRSITVTFSGDVAFANGNAAAAFQLQHVQTGNNVILAAATSLNAAGDSVVTLTFSGSETDPVSALSGGMASLADGRYQLTVFGSAVSDATLGWALDGDGDGNPGGNYVSPTDTLGGAGLHLYRLFGDVTGNGTVDAQDLGALRSAFNTAAGSAFYLSYLDADNSGSIDALDLGQFRSRYNASVF